MDPQGLCRHRGRGEELPPAPRFPATLGRGINYPIALEGALKLKEISYIHAEGYPAGEMKHGPIALIDEHLPVVALAPRDHVFEKMLGNIQEAKARGGSVIAVTSGGDEGLRDLLNPATDYLVTLPTAPRLLTPVVFTLPLRLPRLPHRRPPRRGRRYSRGIWRRASR